MQKKVLITGGSRGIGKAICDELLKNSSYQISTPGRSELDLNSLASVEKFCSDNHDFDIVVNCAGINHLCSSDNVTETVLEEMLTVNLKSALLLCSRNIAHMKQNNYGRIINVSSIWGITSKENRVLYSMTKFGINGITKSLSRELGQYNILVNSICPGYVNTELTKKNVSEEDKKEIIKYIPLGRFAEPSEIAKFVAFLVSPENSYITGQALLIDGGFVD